MILHPKQLFVISETTLLYYVLHCMFIPTFIINNIILMNDFFRYYYDESEDDIDDYSRKPVFCHVVTFSHSRALGSFNQIFTQIKPIVLSLFTIVFPNQVPILLSILLVIVYIVGGAFLFQMWEGWPFLDRFPKP